MLKALALAAPLVVLVGVLLLHRLEVWTLRGRNERARPAAHPTQGGRR